MARIVEYEAYNIVGDKVKAFRIEKHLSQRELSERLETYAVYICRGSVSRIEKKERTVTDFELKAISQALDVPLADLFS